MLAWNPRCAQSDRAVANEKRVDLERIVVGEKRGPSRLGTELLPFLVLCLHQVEHGSNRLPRSDERACDEAFPLERHAYFIAVEERLLVRVGHPHDMQTLDRATAPPQGQIHILDMSLIAFDSRKLLVQVALEHMR